MLFDVNKYKNELAWNLCSSASLLLPLLTNISVIFYSSLPTKPRCSKSTPPSLPSAIIFWMWHPNPMPVFQIKSDYQGGGASLLPPQMSWSSLSMAVCVFLLLGCISINYSLMKNLLMCDVQKPTLCLWLWPDPPPSSLCLTSGRDSRCPAVTQGCRQSSLPAEGGWLLQDEA